MAVFCAIVQAAGAAPDGIFPTEGGPCASPIERPALAAHEPVRQRKFARITRASCHSRFGRAAQGASTCHFSLHCIVLFPADDGLVMVRHIILRHLSDILDDLFADHICPKSFLKQNVTAVLFVRQDALDGCRCPFRFSKNRFDLIFFQPVLQISQAGAALISLVEFAHGLCLFWYDTEFAICVFFVSIKPVTGNLERSDFCVHLPTTPDIAGNGFAFGLRHCAVHRNHKFAVWRQRVDILFFEENPDPKLSEDARIIDAVERIAGKPLDGLCKDEVDLLLLTQANHPQEFCALFRGRACDAFVRENASHCPLFV